MHNNAHQVPRWLQAPIWLVIIQLISESQKEKKKKCMFVAPRPIQIRSE